MVAIILVTELHLSHAFRAPFEGIEPLLKREEGGVSEEWRKRTVDPTWLLQLRAAQVSDSGSTYFMHIRYMRYLLLSLYLHTGFVNTVPYLVVPYGDYMCQDHRWVSQKDLDKLPWRFPYCQCVASFHLSCASFRFAPSPTLSARNAPMHLHLPGPAEV